MIIDIYFKKPILWDYLIAFLLAILSFFLIKNLPNKEECISILSDITNISLTMAGFILTLLTVLITFKSTSNNNKLETNSNRPLFELFFSSSLYFKTIEILKNSIKSIIFVAIIGFSIKLFFSNILKEKIFYVNIIGLTVLILSIWRCLLILGKIIEFQKNDISN